MEKPSPKGTIPNVRKNEDFQYSLLQNMEYYFQNSMDRKVPPHYYNVYSLIGKDDIDRKIFQKIFKQMQQTDDFNPAKLGLSEKQSRGIGSFLGMAICDALGACTQFESYRKQGHGIIKNGFADVQNAIKQRIISSRHGQITTWTDDASMGIAMAFSLLSKKYQFDPIHIRYMFILWLWHGLGNGGRKHSIGLGGNIKISMDQFCQQQTQYASQGQKIKNYNNGNGSLMRLATIPVAFHDDRQKAIKYSALQSRTTHNGFQAEQCCRLLASIIVDMINRQQSNQQSDSQIEKMEIQSPYSQIQNSQEKKQQQEWRALFDKTCQQFVSKEKTVQFLAKSLQQTQELYQQSAKIYKPFKNFNQSTEDRNWNWKQKDFTYSKHRNSQMPGYIGSYCMDGFAMALHTVWHTRSFKQCALMNANMGGDCDTVGSIAGQMAGAIYGVSEQMLRLYSEMKDFKSGRFQAFLLGYKLVNKKGQSVTQQLQQSQQQSQRKRDSSQQRSQQQQHQQQQDNSTLQKKVKKN